jgi:hypothetical protein
MHFPPRPLARNVYLLVRSTLQPFQIQETLPSLRPHTWPQSLASSSLTDWPPLRARVAQITIPPIPICSVHVLPCVKRTGSICRAAQVDRPACFRRQCELQERLETDRGFFLHTGHGGLKWLASNMGIRREG